MVQKKQNLCLNICLNVNRLKTFIGCIPFCHYSVKMNMTTISLTLRVFNAALQNHKVLDNNRNWPKLAFLRSVFY